MTVLRTLTFLCLSLMAALSAHSEVLRIPISQQGQMAIEMPRHGDKQQHVLKRFGEPKQRKASVGQPPITRWDYPNFSVYFEYNTVINSVQNHQPKHPQSP